MTTKSVLLIIGGGIAAYKSLELIRDLSKRGIRSKAILTSAGAEFITPLSVGSLTGAKCYTALFNLTDEAEMGHIELSRSADLLVVAPATADLLAKPALGVANDLASTALLATDKPVLYAPAMNVRMWQHPAVQRNVATLKDDGALFVGPGEGDMACGEFGFGRMAEPSDIADAVEAHFAGRSDGRLNGRHIVVTAGPTHEPIDPVRYLANRSSGKQGYAIAASLARMGAQVTLISGPTELPSPAGVATVRIQTAREMMDATMKALPADAAVCCAAVADYRPEIETEHKIKKERGGLSSIALEENPDILNALSKLDVGRPKLVVGFAAETDDILCNANAKRKRKGCDWIVANDVSTGTGTMGGDNNTVTILSEAGEESWENMPKTQVAGRLASYIADELNKRSC